MFEFMRRKAKEVAVSAIEVAMTPILFAVLIVIAAEKSYKATHAKKLARCKEFITKGIGVANYFLKLHKHFLERSVDFTRPMYFARIFDTNHSELVDAQNQVVMYKGRCVFCNQIFAKTQEKMDDLNNALMSTAYTAVNAFEKTDEFIYLRDEYPNVKIIFNADRNRFELDIAENLNSDLIYKLDVIGGMEFAMHQLEMIINCSKDRCPLCGEKVYRLVYNSRKTSLIKRRNLNNRVKFLGVEFDFNEYQSTAIIVADPAISPAVPYHCAWIDEPFIEELDDDDDTKKSQVKEISTAYVDEIDFSSPRNRGLKMYKTAGLVIDQASRRIERHSSA